MAYHACPHWKVLKKIRADYRLGDTDDVLLRRGSGRRVTTSSVTVLGVKLAVDDVAYYLAHPYWQWEPRLRPPKPPPPPKIFVMWSDDTDDDVETDQT